MSSRFLIFFFLISSSFLFAQEGSTNMIVDSIIIDGNRKTQDRIILRELDFTVGDTLSIQDFEQRMTLAKKRLYNTGLFTLININFRGLNTNRGTMNVVIDLTENLFIYPAPIFELADRNFNVWWEEQNRSFRRVNYGLRLDHFNLTGAKDRFKIKFQRGYTRKYELVYEYPYITNNFGIGSHIFFAEQREIGYVTQGNKTSFFQAADERIMLRRFRTGIDLNYRPSLFNFQNLKLEYHRNTIDDLIALDLNPNYFLNGSNRLRFFLLEYNLDINRRIFDIYPEGGYKINFNIKKEGLGIFKEYNNLPVFIDADKHFKIKKGLITSLRIKAKTNLIRDQLAFANNTGIGYGSDIVGGYELFVLDGSDFFLAETQVKLQVLNKIFQFGKYMPIKGFKKLDLKVFIRGNLDFAYVNERDYIANNNLNNQWIVGYGPAIDVLFFHNFLFKFEYSFNQLGESGLFIHNSIGF